MVAQCFKLSAELVPILSAPSLILGAASRTKCSRYGLPRQTTPFQNPARPRQLHTSSQADISVDIYDKLDGVGAIGGIVGTAVSASFLFLVAVINSWFLFDALRHRRARKQREAMGLPPAENEAQAVHGGGCLVRIVGPILRAVDAPWKLYPVGVLFGFVSIFLGWERASSDGSGEGCERARWASCVRRSDSTEQSVLSETWTTKLG